MRRLDPSTQTQSRYQDLEVRRGAAGRLLPRLERAPRVLQTPLNSNNSWSYRVKEGDRIDRLAGAFLGDVRLWWLLAASGLLAPKLGGAPVFPPQPDGVMSLGQVKREWSPSTGDDRHRRGLRVRSSPRSGGSPADRPGQHTSDHRRGCRRRR